VPHAWLGRALAAKGRLDEAIAECREAVRVRPDVAEGHVSMGEVLGRQGKPDEAIASFDEALRLEPNRGCIHNDLGNALLRKGELDRAVAACKEAVRLGPANHPTHHDNLGRALALRGRLDEAIAEFREVIRLKPDDVAAHDNLGHQLRRQGKLVEAIACYREAIRLQPDFADAHNALAWLLATCPDARIRDVPKAVALVRRAVELAPKEGGYWNTLGVAHYRAGEWKASVAALEKSMELGNGGDAFDWFFLAMARRQLGHADKARLWYDKAVAWTEKNRPKDKELLGFRAEAATLLGLSDLPADVFAPP
jgi:tetratricopeptide (TPR) repeat protein